MFNRIKKLRQEISNLEIEVDRVEVIARQAGAEAQRNYGRHRNDLQLLTRRVAELEYAKWPAPSEDTRSRPQLPDPKFKTTYNAYLDAYTRWQQGGYSLGYYPAYPIGWLDRPLPVTYEEFAANYAERKLRRPGELKSERSARSANPC